VHDFSDNQVQDEEPRESSPRVSHRSNLSNAISLLRSERKALFLLPLGVLSIVVSSFIVIFIVAAFSGLGATVENEEISCSSVAVIFGLISVVGLIIWNLVLGSLAAALIRKYRGLEFEFREVFLISLSAAPAIISYSLLANVIILGTITLTSIDSWPEIASYCRAVIETSETSETIGLPSINLASGSHWAVALRMSTFFGAGDSNSLLLLGEIILLSWSYVTFFWLPLIIFKKIGSKANLFMSFSWARKFFRTIAFWLLIVEFIQFLVIVPLVSLIGLAGLLLIMPIYLFVLTPLTISYKVIVTQSLINDLNGQFDEGTDNKLSDVIDNSYDPARAL
jgi:hypothetical protein